MAEYVFERIPIHYDVESHTLDLDVFIKAAQCIDNIVGELYEKLCEDKVKYKIVILPQESGGFKQWLAIAVIGAGYHFVNTELGSGIVQGLTGKDTKEWGQSIGTCVRECAVSFFAKDSHDLKKSLPKEAEFQKSIKAKNEFYIACCNATEIKGIGFSDEDNFPISRGDFYSHIETVPLLPTNPVYKLQRLIIAAPVTIPDSKTNWRVKIEGYGKSIYSMSMDDRDFLGNFLEGKYPIKETADADKLEAMVRYFDETSNLKASIVKVYKFNNTLIAKFPEGLEFDKGIDTDNPDQLSLEF